MTHKLFISYARKDARELALRLQADLQSDGFETWMDTSEINGGASWSTEIENAIETCTTALALLSPGSYVSEICRAEQLRCLRKGKQLIPILVQADAERPIHLEHLNYRDFTSAVDYKASFEELLRDIQNTKVGPANGKIKETYTNAPALPLNFVERPEERDKLRQELIADDGERRIALTALQGMGGIGKSALAAWICRDEIVQAAFPDGVIWVDVGRENVNLLELIKLVGTKLGDSMGHYSSDVAALSRLRETLPAKSALIVLDDVWRDEHAKAFSDIEAPRSRVLFTSRDASIGEKLRASKVQLGVMKPQQALELLREWAECDLPEMPTIAERLGFLPLALKIAGGRLKEMDGREWLDTFDKDVSSLKTGRRDTSPQGNLEVCFDLSVNLLADEDQLLYHSIGIFPEDLWIPEIVAFKLWQAYNPRLEAVNCRDIARDLHKLALIERREVNSQGEMRLHLILLDYNRVRLKRRAEYENAHQRLLNSYNRDARQKWWELESDGYIYENLAYHLIECERQADLHKLLTASRDWMDAKNLRCNGNSSFVGDLALAMKSYKDPVSTEDLVKWVELNTARQVVNAKVGTFNDDLLRALVYLGREKEAINHARLRPNPKVQFDGLFTIWNIAQEKNEAWDISIEELLQVAQSISDASEQAEALRELAVSLAQAQYFEQTQQVAQSISIAYRQVEALSSLAASLAQAQRFEEADALFSQAHKVTQSISNPSEKDVALTGLAVSLAHAQHFEQAQQVAQSISDAYKQAMALRKLAVRLAQAQRFEQADALFSQAEKIAKSISNPSQRAMALTKLATSLAQAQNPTADAVFSQAHKVIQSISNPYRQARSLRELAASLAQAQRFEQAQKVTQNISNPSLRARALSSLAASLAQAQRFEQANDVFSQAHKAIQGISNPAEQAAALRELVVSLAQAQYFEQAQQIAQSISNAYHRLEALSLLAVHLAQAQRFKQADAVFNQAQEVAQSISDASEQAAVLSLLAASLAQAQNPAADAVFSQAHKATQSISNAYQQLETLSSLALSLAQALRFEQAQQIARNFSNTSQQGRTLSSLAASLAQAQYFEQAEQLALSISNDYYRAWAFRELAVSLAQAQRFEQADAVFSQAEKIAKSISNVSQQSRALSLLAVSLAQAQRFEQADAVFSQAEKIAKSISNAEQAAALGVLAVSLAQAQRFEQAQQLTHGILNRYQQSRALSLLAVSLAQAQRFEQADTVFSQAEKIAKSISNAAEQAVALRELAVNLAQTQRFEQAQQLAQSISNAYQQALALRALAASLAQAQHFEQAQQLAQSISNAYQQALALRALAGSLAQVGLYQKSFFAFGMQSVEETIKLLTSWQTNFAHSPELWEQVMLAALEIICWQHNDFKMARDILRENK